MAVDFRTRQDANTVEIGFDEFFADLLPSFLIDNIDCIDPWLSLNNPGDLSIHCAGESWHLKAVDNSIQVIPGISSTGLLVNLDAEEFSGLVNDLFTPMTFFVSGTLDIQRGDMSAFLDWWLVIRALVDRRPIHVPGTVAFLERDGSPLDLSRSFTLDDNLEDMRHFLETAGFLHVAGVFSEDEMAAISRDIDTFQGKYVEGDERSWWATTKDGTRRLVRLQSFDEHSLATRSILSDPRFRRIGEISGDGHEHSGLEGNAIEALIKPLDVIEGISDLPWHKDCSLGRHSYECCSLTVGISVSGAGADSGQLRVIAGSHRALMWPALLSTPEKYGLPVVELPTATGDITVHLSCTHHMSEAPTAQERRVMYTSFRLPSVSVDSSNESRARINRAREVAYKTVSQ